MMQPIPNAQLEALAQRFVRFANQECGDYAPLYDRLARGIADDPELLSIAAHARSGQQAPLLLLAAVHYLLLGGAGLPRLLPGLPRRPARAGVHGAGPDQRAAALHRAAAGLRHSGAPGRRQASGADRGWSQCWLEPAV